MKRFFLLFFCFLSFGYANPYISSLYTIAEEGYKTDDGIWYTSSISLHKNNNRTISLNWHKENEISYYAIKLNYDRLNRPFINQAVIEGMNLEIDSNDAITLVDSRAIHYEYVKNGFERVTEKFNFILTDKTTQALKNCNSLKIQVQGLSIEVPPEGVAKIREFFVKYPLN
jgi:hypothetical protein